MYKSSSIPYKFLIANCKLPFAFCLLLIANYQFSHAQNPITLNAAIDIALKNNLSVKNEKLKAEYQQKTIKSSANISQTNLSYETGQINSAYTDSRYGISQSFNFPTVYSNQKKVFNEEWKTAVLSGSLKEVEIKKVVTQLFYFIIYLREKEKLLNKVDNNYAEFLTKANLRFAKGESNILEKTTAETQRGNIQLQLNELHQEIEFVNLQFQLLLNTTTYFEPETATPKMDFINKNIDSSFVNQHPLLKILQQQKLAASANTKLERARMYPNLNFSYYNMSIIGTGADNVLYNSSTRFSSAQIGIGVPLFFVSQKAKINVSKVSETIAENNFQQQLQALKVQYQHALSQYETNLRAVQYFEKTGIVNANLIDETAMKQFTNGDINYLDWVILNNQSTFIRTNYLDAIKSLNESIITINYLTSK